MNHHQYVVEDINKKVRIEDLISTYGMVCCIKNITSPEINFFYVPRHSGYYDLSAKNATYVQLLTRTDQQGLRPSVHAMDSILRPLSWGHHEALIAFFKNEDRKVKARYAAQDYTNPLRSLLKGYDFG